jgi:hypothetical protein
MRSVIFGYCLEYGDCKELHGPSLQVVMGWAFYAPFLLWKGEQTSWD